MLFNSFEFLVGFLPLALIGFFALGRRNMVAAQYFLIAASLVFYAGWNPKFVPLLVASAGFNYAAGVTLCRFVAQGHQARARAALAGAITVDLAILGYFKYAGFISQIAGTIAGWPLAVSGIVLPLGISFYTFTQIAFLVDAYRGEVRDTRFTPYLLFVTYFPHLIAGPILHHAQIIPQIRSKRTYRLDWTHASQGLTIFVIGLAKKVLLADQFGQFANPVFYAAQQGMHPQLFEAWSGALAYALQLYFDFSGYSDMAIGLSLFFNIRLPFNFNSPYTSPNIIEFWRRWHMTLSAFLRDYLYIPLGGNRHGTLRRYGNLLLTMLLGGLWHGAGWTFVAWGGLHGLLLVVNHGWRALARRTNLVIPLPEPMRRSIGTGLTFASVVVAWVFFRSDSFGSAARMISGMCGVNGFHVAGAFGTSQLAWTVVLPWLLAGLSIVWLLPNSQTFMGLGERALQDARRGMNAIRWQPERWWSWSSTGVILACSLLTISSHVSQFLYYQF